MKLIGKLWIVLFVMSCTNKICSDPIACKEVENELAIIENYVDHNISPPTSCAPAVDSLTVLTGIPSESSGSDIGQPSPTSDDYKKWSRWYENNKDRLYWDKKSEKVLLRK